MVPKRIPEKEFKYIYSRVPRLCVEVVVQTKKGVVLTKREIPPYKGMWHIPGGTVLNGEKLAEAVKRVALDELGIKVVIDRFLGVIEYFMMDDGRQAVGLVYLINDFTGKLRGSYQGREVNFFKELPDDLIPEQQRFLRENFLC